MKLPFAALVLASASGCWTSSTSRAPALAPLELGRLSQECSSKRARACFEVARAYQDEAAKVPKKLKLARDLYRRACELGDNDGCVALGWIYAEDQRFKNESEALRWFERACQRGDQRACTDEGILIHDGRGIEPNVERATALFRTACEKFYPRGCYNWAVTFPENSDERFQIGRQACVLTTDALRQQAARQPRSRYLGLPVTPPTPDLDPLVLVCSSRVLEDEPVTAAFLGELFARGRFVFRHEVAAARYLRTSCEQGQMTACYRLATLVEAGRGVPKSEATSIALYERACQKGRFQPACVRLAAQLEEGRGAAKDVGRAAALYQGACQATSDPFACFRIAYLLVSGESITKDEARGTALFGQLCDDGDLSACFNFGVHLEQGRGIAKDTRRALELYQEFCRDRNQGCFDFARLALERRDSSEQVAEAMAVLERDCGKYDHMSCYYLARRYEQGLDVAADEQRALKLYEAACLGRITPACGDVGRLRTRMGLAWTVPAELVRRMERACAEDERSSCSWLGVLTLEGQIGDKHGNEAKGAGLLARACELGSGSSCTRLGTLYLSGTGVEQDDGRAAELFRQSCDQGDHAACYDLGLLEESGRGVPISAERARTLFESACAGGQVLACYRLGRFYDTGNGVPKDRGRAAELYQRACDAEVVPACTNLGHLLAEGYGVTRNPARAAQLFERACERGSAIACSNLALLYRLGTGVRRDPGRFEELTARACSLGSSEACRPGRKSSSRR